LSFPSAQKVHEPHSGVVVKSRFRCAARKTRSASPRQIAAATAEQRAATARLAESLKQAYAELDRLRAQVNGPGSKARTGPVDGFALTQPFEQSM